MPALFLMILFFPCNLTAIGYCLLALLEASTSKSRFIDLSLFGVRLKLQDCPRPERPCGTELFECGIGR